MPRGVSRRLKQEELFGGHRPPLQDFEMSEASNKRSEEFLKISGQFKLGALVTESSHPVTANLSEVAKKDIAKALDLLFQVDNDVIAKYREFAKSGRAE